MPSIDAVGSTVRRRDGEILNVDVDVSRGTGGLLALDPLSGLGRVAAYGRLSLRLSDTESERRGQHQGDGAHPRPRAHAPPLTLGVWSLESGPYHIHEMQTRLGRRSNHLESSPVNSA